MASNNLLNPGAPANPLPSSTGPKLTPHAKLPFTDTFIYSVHTRDSQKRVSVKSKVSDLMLDELTDVSRADIVEITVSYTFTGAGQYFNFNYMYTETMLTGIQAGGSDGGISDNSGANNDHCKKGGLVVIPENCSMQMKPVPHDVGLGTMYLSASGSTFVTMTVYWQRYHPRIVRKAITLK